MSMAGRSRNGFRLVSLVAAAATLLAAWLPPGQACACGPVTPINTTVTAAAPAFCPCCGTRPAADQARRPCCPAPANSAPATGCACSARSRPANPEPAVPPRPTAGDDHPVLFAAVFAPPAHGVAPAGPPAAELAIHAAGPPPIDLIISLSRLTC
jgi:hypothetical protein